jgi:hypothetical protein
MSQVEKIAALQEQLWSTTNQRLDVLQLASSGILMINEDLVDDPDSIVFGPGEKMLARGDLKAALDIWGPDTTAAQISLPAENFLKQDMQNLAGGFPFTSTSEASNVKADTATEAALVSSMAQRSVSAAKINLNYMYRRIGQQMIELNQQYITEPLIVTAVGADNEYELNEIVPEMLAGEWEFDISPMNESLNRQEKRAEAGAFMQQWLAAAPTISAMAQAGLAKMISMDAVVDDFLDAYDKGDKERYYVSSPPPGGLPGQSGQPGQEQGQQGTTAPQSIDPAVSPSNSMSLSPATAMSRFQAGQGGNNNIG